ncbi:hypothetical protein [Pontibacter pamirensis]|uniref:hypothetical protein n=1 Tax=Pontibacter pamirensis TaxID=2562824 RepID=UPI001389EE18|nr:hypothetical protein [Pontibacter pamirensis]
MKLLFFILFITLPYFSFSQGFKVKVAGSEFPVDKVPEHVTFPARVKKFSIKKDKPDQVPATYTVQIGEEERSFRTDGAFHEVEFSHDIRGLVIYILNEKRVAQGKTLIIKKPK